MDEVILPEIDGVETFHAMDMPSTKTEDVFRQGASKLKDYDGIDPNTKRRASYAVNKYLTGAQKTGSKQVEQEALDGYGMFKAVPPPYDLNYLSKLYEVSPYHYAAVDAKVANVVGLGYDFIESPLTKDALSNTKSQSALDKARRRLERAKRELNDWLDSCNEDSLFVETLIKVYTDYETTGNGYLEIGRTTSGAIMYIGHIPSTTIRVRSNRDGFVQIVSNRVTFFRNFGDRKTADPIGNDRNPNEIIHFKNYSPTSGYYGVPNVVAAKVPLAGNEFAGRFNLDYFEFKAAPRYVIVLKGATLSESSRSHLLEFFQSGLKGKNHRSIFLPLPADDPNNKVEFKMEPVETNVQDGSFSVYRKDNRDEILMAHRVPISKIGIPSGVSLAEARDADKTFKEQVTRPIQQIIEKKINKIIATRTDALVLKLRELTLTDEDTQSQIDERYLRMQVITPNEVRARKGMASLDGGDTVVDLKPQQAAEQRTQATGNRQRDQQRTANATDNRGEARNPKGEGRTQA